MQQQVLQRRQAAGRMGQLRAAWPRAATVVVQVGARAGRDAGLAGRQQVRPCPRPATMERIYTDVPPVRWYPNVQCDASRRAERRNCTPAALLQTRRTCTHMAMIWGHLANLTPCDDTASCIHSLCPNLFAHPADVPSPPPSSGHRRVQASSSAAAQPSTSFMPAPQLAQVQEPAAQAMASGYRRVPVVVPGLSQQPVNTAFVGERRRRGQHC